jgi:hypothetical protein
MPAVDEMLAMALPGGMSGTTCSARWRTDRKFTVITSTSGNLRPARPAQ